MQMHRKLGLDIGDHYIGIAVSDPLDLTAQPYRTYKRKTREDDLAFFKELVDQYGVQTIVAGLPLNMDDTESSQTRKARNYAGFLKNALGVKIVYVDERLTTESAADVLIETGVRREKRKEKIDTIAAQFILQEYLDAAEKE